MWICTRSRFRLVDSSSKYFGNNWLCNASIKYKGLKMSFILYSILKKYKEMKTLQM